MWLEEVPRHASWRAIFTEGLMDLEGTGVSIQEAMSIVCMVLYTITKLDQRAPEAAMILASLSGHDQELPVMVYHASVCYVECALQDSLHKGAWWRSVYSLR